MTEALMFVKAEYLIVAIALSCSVAEGTGRGKARVTRVALVRAC
jgi:hypothetical protein